MWSFQALMIEFLTNVAKEREQKGLLRISDDLRSSVSSPRLFAMHQHLPQFQASQEQFQKQEQLLVALAMGSKVIFTPPCLFCMGNRE